MNKEQKIQELTKRIEKSQAEIDELKEELKELQDKPYEISYPNDGEKIYFISYHSGQVKEWDFDISNEADINITIQLLIECFMNLDYYLTQKKK